MRHESQPLRSLIPSLVILSWSSSPQVLEQKKSIGISTGGVAEVFETNSKTGDEVVVLKSRQGLVKLAMRTGASLVPCYLFGNTQLYSVWYGEEGSSLREIIRSISRKIGQPASPLASLTPPSSPSRLCCHCLLGAFLSPNPLPHSDLRSHG